MSKLPTHNSTHSYVQMIHSYVQTRTDDKAIFFTPTRILDALIEEKQRESPLSNGMSQVTKAYTGIPFEQISSGECKILVTFLNGHPGGNFTLCQLPMNKNKRPSRRTIHRPSV